MGNIFFIFKNAFFKTNFFSQVAFFFQDGFSFADKNFSWRIFFWLDCFLEIGCFNPGGKYTWSGCGAGITPTPTPTRLRVHRFISRKKGVRTSGVSASRLEESACTTNGPHTTWQQQALVQKKLAPGAPPKAPVCYTANPLCGRWVFLFPLLVFSGLRSAGP